LLRLEGVPTRYVTGFVVSASSFEAGHYVVRMSDAHAWIEAYLDGVWREVDPTPPAEYERLHARPWHWWSVAGEWVRGAWMWLTAAVRQCLRAGDVRWLTRQAVAALRYFVSRPLAVGAVLLLLAAWRLPIRRWLVRLRRRRASASAALPDALFEGSPPSQAVVENLRRRADAADVSRTPQRAVR
jgi:hypothetical protein